MNETRCFSDTSFPITEMSADASIIRHFSEGKTESRKDGNNLPKLPSLPRCSVLQQAVLDSNCNQGGGAVPSRPGPKAKGPGIQATSRARCPFSRPLMTQDFSGSRTPVAAQLISAGRSVVPAPMAATGILRIRSPWETNTGSPESGGPCCWLFLIGKK